MDIPQCGCSTEYDIAVNCIYLKEEIKNYPEYSTDDFFDMYPNFTSFCKEEILILIQFANYVRLIRSINGDQKFKMFAMIVLPRIVENWETRYVTGGGQTTRINRRTHIYEMETGKFAIKRTKKRCPPPPTEYIKKTNKRRKTRKTSLLDTHSREALDFDSLRENIDFVPTNETVCDDFDVEELMSYI